MRTNKLKIIHAILLAAGWATLFAGAWQWAGGFGGSSLEAPWDLAVDASQSNAGEFYVGGEFSETLTVNGTDYPGMGLSDCFIIKYSAQGNVLWVRAVGSTEADICVSLAADASGNCYFTGFYSAPLSYGGYDLPHQGTWDVLYGKFSPAGDLVWLKRFGGTNSEIGYGIEAAPSGDFYITGWFGGTIDFSPTLSLTSFGGSDMFLAKFDADGNPLWARHAGTSGVEYGYKVDIANHGADVYVTGAAGPGTNFDGIITDTQGMYAAKYDSSGNIQWVLPSYGPGALNISCDEANSANQRNAVIGRATGMVQIGDAVYQSVDGSDDIYVAYFDEAGNWTDVEFYGGPGTDKGRSVDIRYAGQLEASVSTFENTMSFGGYQINSTGASDILVSAMDYPPAIGGGSNLEIATDIKFLNPDKIVVSGWYVGHMDFPGIHLSSSSDSDQNAFVAVYDFSASDLGDPSMVPAAGIVCYPNPGSGPFTIASAKHSPVEIFNLRGQKVATLFPSGAKTTEFIWNALDVNGSPCPAGIYLVRAGDSFQRLLYTGK